ncbi:polysaccharide pyruvyl transferase family protein [Agarivorans litoreus]|uniref:polysaccharide pyruvyl transferase family protein n=1 Tax=Agarivorans litoreus TaxID=1510455 RepID=UPI001C7DD750|nr:polysaccharide pyruvyl transferase family protein [Agarivorans litoreus]
MNFSSVFSQVKLLAKSRPLPLEKPTVIQFPVIDTCNSKCQMCRIWENKKSQDITISQLKMGLESPLFSEVMGIGFNGGEPTLRADLPELVDTVVTSLPKLNSVSLITNAYKYLQVIEQIEAVAKIVKSKGLHFDLMVSLDGYGDVHDKVRGRSGNFENAKKVLEFAKDNPLIDNLRIGCTVIRENVLKLPDLLEYCIENNLYVKYRLGVPHQRLYTENLLDPYALSFEEKYEFVEFLEGLIKDYETSPHQLFFYRSLIEQIIRDKPRQAGCDWKHRGATITAKGELAYCAVQSKPLMESIAKGDPLTVFFDNEEHLKDIVNNKCETCHHDYVGIPDRKTYQKQFLERLDQRFGVKNIVRSLPGFSLYSKRRREKHFINLLEHHRTVEATVHPKSINSKTILICGWYGTETLGDKGIIAGVMHGFREIYGSDVQFVVVALHTYITEITRRQMKEFSNCRIVTTEQGAAIAGSMDYVVFGGGPLMGIDELAPMQAIFERAKAVGVTTIVAGCGVGPFGEQWHDNSLKSILELSDKRIYRDKRSLDYATSLGVHTTNDVVAEDPAFTWLASIEPTLDVALREKTSKKVLLLGLRDFPYQEYARHLPEAEALAIKDNYEKVIIESLSQLVQNIPDIVIRPLPMCTNHFGSDDRWFYRRIFRGHKQLKDNLDLSLLGAEMAPIEYCKAFKNADALLAMRFHSLVFGLALGTNSVALDYTLGKGKVRSLAERFDAELVSMINLSTGELTRQIMVALDNEKPQPIKLDNLSFSSSLKQLLGA